MLAGLVVLTIYLCKLNRRSQRRKYLTDDEDYLILPVRKPAVRPPSYPNRSAGAAAAKNVSRAPFQYSLLRKIFIS